MDFNYGSGFGVVSPPAYERLIGDAIRGDQTLFTRWDAVERAWELVMPVLDVWTSSKDFSFPNYAAGSQGPPSAVKLFPGWREL
jgi:glucose-6-phosphate 1-dehydrogenase